MIFDALKIIGESLHKEFIKILAPHTSMVSCAVFARKFEILILRHSYVLFMISLQRSMRSTDKREIKFLQILNLKQAMLLTNAKFLTDINNIFGPGYSMK